MEHAIAMETAVGGVMRLNFTPAEEIARELRAYRRQQPNCSLLPCDAYLKVDVPMEATILTEPRLS